MQGRKLPGLDVLRGIAILLVIFSHLLAPTLGSSIFAGNAGVILFFLLSGYLMDRNLAIDPAIGPYVIRRAFRILPPYWFSIALIALTTSNWSVPQVASNAAFTAPLFGITRMSGVYWTLYVEVVFYVLAPILFVLGNVAIRFAPLVFAILIGLFWGIHGVFIFAPMYVLFCLLGMMVGSLHRNGLIAWFTSVTQVSFWPLEYCGRISYSWYLTHTIISAPVLNLGAQMNFGHLVTCIAAVIVSFIASAAIFHLFENPSIEVGRRLVKRMTAPSLKRLKFPIA